MLLLSIDPASVYAFACTRVGGPDSICIHWTTGSATLRTFLGTPAATPLLNGSVTWDDNAISAADEWNAVGAPFHFSVTVGGPFTTPCGSGPGHACPNTGPLDDNPVFFAADACGQGFGDIIELTINCYFPDSGAMINAPVFVNQNVPWNAYDGPIIRSGSGQVIYDVRRVLLNHFGHVLGLSHPDEAGQSVVAIMNSRVSNLDRLQPDDIAGVSYLYSCSAGDCGGDGQTTADDLIVMVNVALGVRNVDAYRQGDLDHNEAISIDEIIRAVSAALLC